MRTVLPSVCTLDCPDTCSLSVEVHQDRIMAVRGSKANPYTGGTVCNKVSKLYPDFVHGPGRLTTPLRRTGAKGEGRFAPIGWDEALDLVHQGFEKAIAAHGPQSILPLNYAGPHGMLAVGSMDLRFFHKLGASVLFRRAMCGGVRGEAWAGTFGAVPGIPPEEAEHSALIVVWGNNVTYCNLHLTPIIHRAKKAGAKVVVVDPRRTKIAEQAHLHLAVLPGTDGVLAWAIAAELERRGGLDTGFIAENVHGFEEFMAEARKYPPEVAAEICGIAEADIRTLAEWYHTCAPAAISVGNGLERNRNGGSAIRAIFALPALAGKFGVTGGGLINGAGNAFPRTGRLGREDLIPPGTRTINIIDVGPMLLDPTLDPPIKALFIYNHNPVVVHPRQRQMIEGLKREDLFTVGCDVVMTDSLAYADVVLPAASHFEHGDLYGAYGQQWLQRAEPVIPPVGDCLPNTEIFRRLAARFGFDGPEFTASDTELMDEALNAADPRMGGTPASQLPVGTALAMQVDGAPISLCRTTAPATPSGKVELRSAMLEQTRGAPLPTYRAMPTDTTGNFPLVLISPASNMRISSTFGGLSASDAAPPLEMHPHDAAARDLREGMTVRIWNELGEVFLPLRITDTVRPGVVSSDKGAWMRTSTNGLTVSALVPTHYADLAEGACFNDCPVEVAPA